MDILRIGRISSINYTAGTARVVYKDRDNAVTAELPLLAYEYCVPEIDDLVLVCHLPNGSAAGVILGPFWNGGKRPPEGSAGLYRKDFDKTPGVCFMRYKDGVLTISAQSLALGSGGQESTYDALLDRVDQLERAVEDLQNRVETLENEAENHTHPYSGGDNTGPPN